MSKLFAKFISSQQVTTNKELTFSFMNIHAKLHPL